VMASLRFKPFPVIDQFTVLMVAPVSGILRLSPTLPTLSWTSFSLLQLNANMLARAAPKTIEDLLNNLMVCLSVALFHAARNRCPSAGPIARQLATVPFKDRASKDLALNFLIFAV
jgi:hypothetical protein